MKKLLLSLPFLFSCIFIMAQQPVLDWARKIEGSPSDAATVYDVGADNIGNVYTTGIFYGTIDFDPGPAIFNLSSSNMYGTAYITKFDTAGNFIWVKAFNGSNNSAVYSITLDSDANVCVAGSFRETVDFDPGPGVFNLSSLISYQFNAYVAKLDSSGNFIWAKSFAGNLSQAIDVAVDFQNNIYVAGVFEDTCDLNPGSAVFPLISKGRKDMFLVKLSDAGIFQWAKTIGGTGNDYCTTIATNNSNDIYVCGYYEHSVDFDPGMGTFILTDSIGFNNPYILKLDSAGSFVWVKTFEGAGNAQINSVAVSSSGDVFTTGYLSGTVDFDPGPSSALLTGIHFDTFISKIDASGNYLWAKDLASSVGVISHTISLDAANNIYISGHFLGTVDFDPGIGIENITAIGYYSDIFLAKYNSNGNYSWAKSIGDTLDERIILCAATASGNLYCTGSFFGTLDFDFNSGTVYLTGTGGGVIFLAKITNGTVGLQENALNTDFYFYPNPNTSCSELKIQFKTVNNEKGILQIFDVEARLVFEKVISTSTQSITLPFLNAGVYNCQIAAESGKSSHKLIIEN